MRLLLVLLLILLAAATAPRCFAVVMEKTFTTYRESMQGIVRYGFRTGGNMQLRIELLTLSDLQRAAEDQAGHSTPSSSSSSSSSRTGGLFFLACDNDHLAQLYEARDTLCLQNTTFDWNCYWQDEIRYPEKLLLQLNETVEETLYLNLLYLNCYDRDFLVKASAVFRNPNGEHLSSGDIPLKMVTPFYLVIWLLTELIWWSNIMKYRHEDAQLQIVLSLVPMAAVIRLVLLTVSWTRLSEKGYTTAWLLGGLALSQGIFRSAFYFCLLLIARGWMITRMRLPLVDWQVIVVLSAAYGLACAAWDFFMTFVSLFLMITLYVLLLRYIFGIQMYRQLDVRQEQIPFLSQLLVYKNLRSSLILFVCLDLLFRVWGVVALQEMHWVEFVLEETWLLLLCFGIGYTFSLGNIIAYDSNIDDFIDSLRVPHDPYLALQLLPQLLQRVPRDPERVPLMQTRWLDYQSAERRRQQSGDETAASRMEVGGEAQSHPQVVLVQHPSRIDDQGKETLNYSVGRLLDTSQ